MFLKKQNKQITSVAYISSNVDMNIYMYISTYIHTHFHRSSFIHRHTFLYSSVYKYTYMIYRYMYIHMYIYGMFLNLQKEIKTTHEISLLFINEIFAILRLQLINIFAKLNAKTIQQPHVQLSNIESTNIPDYLIHFK